MQTRLLGHGNQHRGRDLDVEDDVDLELVVPGPDQKAVRTSPISKCLCAGSL